MIATSLAFLKANKLAAGIGALVVLGLLIFTISRFVSGTINKIEDMSKEAGAAKITNDNLEATLKRTEQGNEAKNEIRNDIGSARYHQCMRTARTTANCQRFLPEQPAD